MKWRRIRHRWTAGKTVSHRNVRHCRTCRVWCHRVRYTLVHAECKRPKKNGTQPEWTPSLTSR